MFLPTFTLTHNLVNTLIKFELAQRDIKTLQITDTIYKTIQEDLAENSLKSLSSLINVKASEDTIHKIVSGELIPPPGSDHLVLLNYRSTLEFISSTANDSYFSFSSALLLHLNKLLLHGCLESWEIGRFASSPHEKIHTYDPWLRKLRDTQSAVNAEKHFNDVLSWFSSSKGHIHKLIKSAVVFRELLVSYPFLSGNLVSALTINDLLLDRSKLSLKGLVSTPTLCGENSERIVSAITVSDSKTDAQADSDSKSQDVTTWIELYCEMVTSEVITIKNSFNKKLERKVYQRKQGKEQLNPRQKKVLRHLTYNGRITRKEYIKLTGVSTMTAYRDLNEMVDRKLIMVKGGGRSTHYVLREPGSATVEELAPRRRNIVKTVTDTSFSTDDGSGTGGMQFSPESFS